MTAAEHTEPFTMMGPLGCNIGCDRALLPGPHARGMTALHSTSCEFRTAWPKIGSLKAEH